jgi:signal recognition particle receptor subunit beta
MVSVNSSQDRTILLDLLPLKTPAFRGYDLRLQLLAVPGQTMYAASRKLLLNGADGIVFVANSAADRWQETLTSLREMNENLISHGLDPSTIPLVFQYNKRDLPDTTPLDAMDRTLNVRSLDSFPAVAIREEGVVEAFGGILHHTLADVTQRYQIGEELRDARSIQEWTEETMKVIFGWSLSSGKPENVPRVTVRVPVAANVTEPSAPSAAAAANDPAATEALVESYAEAAAYLTSALDEMKDESDRNERRIEELNAPIDAAEELLMGGAAEDVLRKVLERIGRGLGASKGSLSMVRPDGELEAVAKWRLDSEHLITTKDETGQLLAPFILEAGSPKVHVRGESSAYDPVLQMAGEGFHSLVAIPVKTPVRTLGLLSFYLSRDCPIPGSATMPHLARLGRGLALALEVAAGAIASQRLERMERATIVGQLAERALMEIGLPVDRLFMALGQILNRSDIPSWLVDELTGVGADLTRTKTLRDGVLAFMAGRLPDRSQQSIEELMSNLQAELGVPLDRAGIKLELTKPAEAVTVRADGFLLRSALLALVDHSRSHMSGRQGGVIRLEAQSGDGGVSIKVSDNCGSLGGNGKSNGNPDYLAWSLDRKVRGARLALVQTVVEHFKGKWKMKTLPGQGNETVIVLPAS